MNTVEEVRNFLDETLLSNPIAVSLDTKDISYNGLQVRANVSVRSIMFAVSISEKIIQEGVQNAVDMIVCHHGMFWKGLKPTSVFLQRGLSAMYESRISLYASHLPLDYHRLYGNNVGIAEKLGFEYHDEDFCEVGVVGRYKTPMSSDNFLEKVYEVFPNTFDSYNSETLIQRVGICSGSGGYPALYEAIDKGLDAIIVGDTFLFAPTAQDANLSVAACGHHQTEVFGVLSLSCAIRKQFPEIDIMLSGDLS